ncbi:hypothetical protein COU59_02505 [Candidatus Pacearchaeota archaeon CG10_big_fil_rev_8_21_14_0_10_34_12]|nr:MAG: hypothetical protein COU59_02505 [Candidatus Pacearchaeota archaeon CG10_big_fil_rev_8_21_14_0_10_34_12]
MSAEKKRCHVHKQTLNERNKPMPCCWFLHLKVFQAWRSGHFIFDMGSPNSKSKKSMERKQICSICGKKYAMDWAKNNHERLCEEREK